LSYFSPFLSFSFYFFNKLAVFLEEKLYIYKEKKSRKGVISQTSKIFVIFYHLIKLAPEASHVGGRKKKERWLPDRETSVVWLVAL